MPAAGRRRAQKMHLIHSRNRHTRQGRQRPEMDYLHAASDTGCAAVKRAESAVRSLATSISRDFASPAARRGHRDRLVTMAGLAAGTGAPVRGV